MCSSPIRACSACASRRTGKGDHTMSELVNIRDNQVAIRWKLLTSVSALALAVTVSSGSVARAEDASQPLVWIELGSNLDQRADTSNLYRPPFVSQIPSD